jgi:hypothetical protein
MSPIDKFEIYGWMKVHYRQVAETAGFFAKNTEERWATIRQHLLADNPPNGPTLAAAIDGVTKADWPEVLSWLETRRRESIESK